MGKKVFFYIFKLYKIQLILLEKDKQFRKKLCKSLEEPLKLTSQNNLAALQPTSSAKNIVVALPQYFTCFHVHKSVNIHHD